MNAIAVVTLAFYWTWRRTRKPAASNIWLVSFGIIGIILAMGLCTGAVQLVASHEYSQVSDRFLGSIALPSNQKIPYHYMSDGMWPQSIVSILFPFTNDGKLGTGELWSLYIGVLPFFLAAIAIWKRWTNRWVQYLTGLAIASFCYSLGGLSVLHGLSYAFVPFLWMAREASRFLFLAAFALSALAGFGTDALFKAPAIRPALSPLIKWLAITDIAILLLSNLFTPLHTSYWEQFSVLLIAASLAALAMLLRKPASPAVRAVVFGLVLFDLAGFNWLIQDIIAAARPSASEPA